MTAAPVVFSSAKYLSNFIDNSMSYRTYVQHKACRSDQDHSLILSGPRNYFKFFSSPFHNGLHYNPQDAPQRNVHSHPPNPVIIYGTVITPEML